MRRWAIIGLLLGGCATADGAGRYAAIREIPWWQQIHDRQMCGVGSGFLGEANDRCMEKRGYRVVTP